MRQKFNSSTFAVNSISKFRIIVGLVMGLGYSFIFYAFQFILRETIRVLSVSDAYEIWILTDQEVTFYNWFFAAVAVLVGQSICLTYWYSKPHKFGNKRRFSRASIINNQQFLLSNFLMWCLKLGFLYGLFFGMTWPNSHRAFSLYPKYSICFFVLLILLLFFQSWNSIRLKIKGKTYQWMLISFFSLGGLSYGISSVHIVDFRAFEKKMLKQNMEYTYNLQVPVEKEFYVNDYCSISGDNYYLVRDTADVIKTLLKQDRITPFSDSEQKILIKSGRLLAHDLRYNHDIIPALYIDRRIPMQVVIQLFQLFNDEDYWQLGLAVKDSEKTIENRVLPYRFLIVKPGFITNLDAYETMLSNTASISNKIDVYQDEAGKYKFNNTDISNNIIAEMLFRSFMNEPDFYIHYHCDDQLNYEDYIHFRLSCNRAALRLRNVEAWDKYGMPFEGCNFEIQQHIAETHPLRIIEVTSQLENQFQIEKHQ